MKELEPDSAQELAEALKSASLAKHKILVGGAFTKNAMGGPIEPASVKISTRKLDRMRKYEPRDLTVGVDAGMRYSELTRTLAEHGQMLPLDPPWRDQATIGGIVAANTTGPRRRLYGTVRDQAIGMTFATLDGQLAETGGMVVKNVAGLDMLKLLAGSFGTLAVITSVNFKLAPIPESTRTFVLSFRTAQEAAAARDGILGSVLQPAALDCLNAKGAGLFELEGYCLLIRAGGSEAVLRRYAAELKCAEIFEGPREETLWRGVEEFVAEAAKDSNRVTVKLLHPLKALQTVIEGAPGPALGRAGNGVTWLIFDGAPQAEEWLRRTAGNGWTRVVETASEDAKRRLELWSPTGDDLEWMKKLKSKFDPEGLLNPLRLYGRI